MTGPGETASHLKVSLVATVKDAAPFVGEFLASVRSQPVRFGLHASLGTTRASHRNEGGEA